MRKLKNEKGAIMLLLGFFVLLGIGVSLYTYNANSTIKRANSAMESSKNALEKEEEMLNKYNSYYSNTY